MSKKVHPLFMTRGVPGTHDINLINMTIKQLKKKEFKSVLIPKFDKSIDNRLKKSKWIKVKKQPDIIIFEGWCVGAKNQKKNFLKKPINIIEKNMTKISMEKKVNHHLKKNYKKLFNKIDKLVYLKAPSFNHIFQMAFTSRTKIKIDIKK